MGEEFEKTTKESLGTEKGPIPTTIKLLAIQVDKRFEAQEELQKKRHEELLAEIRANRREHHDMKKKLSVVLFFSEHPKAFYSVVVGFLILVANDAKNFWDYLNK